MDEMPATLLEAITYFSDPMVCHDFMVNLRWPDGVVECPTCGSRNVGFLPSRNLFQCRIKHPKRQFSIKVGTIFEDSPIGLEKWLPALWMIANDKNGISSYELHRALGVTQKTAWFMLHRIRLAMQCESFDKMGGEVEVDETFIGGAARFMHKDKRAQKITGTGMVGKTAVMGLLERHGPDGHSRVRTKVIKDRKRGTVVPVVKEHVEPGSEVMTDALASYKPLQDEYIHEVIDHAESYVRGKVHTNGIENFWSLLKRALKGTYVSVEPFHLFRYVDEQAFRYNARKTNDKGRFVQVSGQVVGKRLTYKYLTGKAASIDARTDA
jgi:hypothetical protein